MRWGGPHQSLLIRMPRRRRPARSPGGSAVPPSGGTTLHWCVFSLPKIKEFCATKQILYTSQRFFGGAYFFGVVILKFLMLPKILTLLTPGIFSWASGKFFCSLSVVRP